MELLSSLFHDSLFIILEQVENALHEASHFEDFDLLELFDPFLELR
jgi:hypothetical protein